MTRRSIVALSILLSSTLWAADKAPPGGSGSDLGALHGNMAPRADVGDVRVPKATGPDARTVAEVITGAASLKNRTVVVRGKVVRFTRAVMGKNWVHLRDGSGSAADNTHDVIVTTLDEAKVGDVVVAKGVVRTDVALGSGYSYKVLIENATLQK
jgi:hypothetical protein